VGPPPVPPVNAVDVPLAVMPILVGTVALEEVPTGMPPAALPIAVLPPLLPPRGFPSLLVLLMLPVAAAAPTVPATTAFPGPLYTALALSTRPAALAVAWWFTPFPPTLGLVTLLLLPTPTVFALPGTTPPTPVCALVVAATAAPLAAAAVLLEFQAPPPPALR
jgi:hypothetical protein